MNPDEVAKDLSKREFKDHAKNVVAAAISGIPVIGGPLSSLLSEYLPEWKEKRVLKFIYDLAEEFNRLEDRVDLDYINKEEFAYLFESVFLRVLREYRTEKLEDFKSLLVNSCVRQDIKTDIKEYFLSLINRLDVIHMHILSLFWDPDGFASKHALKPPIYIQTGSCARQSLLIYSPLAMKSISGNLPCGI